MAAAAGHGHTAHLRKAHALTPPRPVARPARPCPARLQVDIAADPAEQSDEVVRFITGPRGRISRLEWLDDNRVLLSASEDGFVRRWDVEVRAAGGLPRYAHGQCSIVLRYHGCIAAVLAVPWAQRTTLELSGRRLRMGRPCPLLAAAADTAVLPVAWSCRRASACWRSRFTRSTSWTCRQAESYLCYCFLFSSHTLTSEKLGEGTSWTCRQEQPQPSLCLLS